MNLTTDEIYMRRCLQLAQLGRYTAAPNPLVGSLIVHNNLVIGEGFHHHAGGAHAEINALHAVTNPSLLPESTLYVNLEPCSHHGRTPPCAERIIREKIARVVIGCRDHSAKVNGSGIALLKQAGISVTENILAPEAEALNRVFFTNQLKQRPFITLKWAQTKDGFMDKIRTKNEMGSYPISGKASRVWTHQLRAQHTAIMVGARTANTDNPMLNVRYFAGKNPIPVVWDPYGKVNGNHPLRQRPDSLYFTFPETPEGMQEMMRELQKRNLSSLLVEGGAHTLQQFIDSSLWDIAYTITAPQHLQKGKPAPLAKGRETDVFNLGNDTIRQYRL